MQKKDLFFKLNKKDYNNILEQLLEKKYFSANTKNLLLSMFYKIEVSYKDYKTVKRNVKTQNEYIEEVLNIIEQCNKIKLIEPKSNESKILEENDENSIVIYDKKEIISYPTEKALIKGLFRLNSEQFLVKSDYVIKLALQDLLINGNTMNNIEVIYDFDGWSWNKEIEKEEDIIYNLIYQNLQMLLNYKWIDEWKTNEDIEIDYIQKLKEKLKLDYGEENSIEIYNKINNILLILLVKNYKKVTDEIIANSKEFINQLEYMNNKTVYLEDISNNKKEYVKEIKKIDNILNNYENLLNEYKKRNEKLNAKEKIFSISHLELLLNKERKKLLDKIKQCNNSLEPLNYIEKKSQLQEKIQIAENLKNVNVESKNLFKNIIQLQINFLDCIEYKVLKANEKNEILDLLYWIRYYKYLKIMKDEYIKDIEKIVKVMFQVERKLITKACNLKIINLISVSMKENIEIISKILTTKIIELENIEIIVKKQNEKIIIEIYDVEVLEDTIEIICDLQKLKVKLNKKIKLFI